MATPWEVLRFSGGLHLAFADEAFGDERQAAALSCGKAGNSRRSCGPWCSAARTKRRRGKAAADGGKEQDDTVVFMFLSSSRLRRR